MPVPLTLSSIPVTTEPVLPVVQKVVSMSVVEMMKNVSPTTGSVMDLWTVEMAPMNPPHVHLASVERVSSSVATTTVPW